MDYTYSDIAKMIDHSLLNPAMTADVLETGCRMALEYDVASVCVLPYFAKRASEILAGSDVMSGTTIGFPHGGHDRMLKATEAERALIHGCQELDMVVNVSQVRSGNWGYVARDIKAVNDLTHAAGGKLKVIFENCYLNGEQKIRLCRICSDLHVDWIKTSTGFGTGGATLDDLKLMRENAAEHVKIKAAGGIKDLDTVLEMRAVGVTRIGASATRAILDDCKERLA